MKVEIGKCKACGQIRQLVCDIRDEWGLAGMRSPKPFPTVCLDCWLQDGWRKVRYRRRGELPALILLVAMLTGMVWLFSAFYWRSHGLDSKTCRLVLYLPTVLGVGIFPMRILEMRLMPHYGPFMELLPTFPRLAAAAVPGLLFLLTTFAAFLAALYCAEGREGFMSIVFDK